MPLAWFAEVPNEVLRGGVAMKDACVWQLDKRTSEHKRAHNMMIPESDAFHGTSSVQDICWCLFGISVADFDLKNLLWFSTYLVNQTTVVRLLLPLHPSLITARWATGWPSYSVGRRGLHTFRMSSCFLCRGASLGGKHETWEFWSWW